MREVHKILDTKIPTLYTESGPIIIGKEPDCSAWKGKDCMTCASEVRVGENGNFTLIGFPEGYYLRLKACPVFQERVRLYRTKIDSARNPREKLEELRKIANSL